MSKKFLNLLCHFFLRNRQNTNNQNSEGGINNNIKVSDKNNQNNEGNINNIIRVNDDKNNQKKSAIIITNNSISSNIELNKKKHPKLPIYNKVSGIKQKRHPVAHLFTICTNTKYKINSAIVNDAINENTDISSDITDDTSNENTDISSDITDDTNNENTKLKQKIVNRERYLIDMYSTLLNNRTMYLIHENNSNKFIKTYLYGDNYINYFGNKVIIFAHTSSHRRLPIKGWLHNCFICDRITGNYVKFMPEEYKKFNLHINICQNCEELCKKRTKLQRKLNNSVLYILEYIDREKVVVDYT